MATFRQFLQDVIGDLPEAAFASLIRAVREARWSRNAGVRMVIWIGDHGNRAIGDAEIFGVEDVRSALRKQNITFFVPINVSGYYHADHNKSFIDQAAEITRFSSGQGGGYRVTKTYDKRRGSVEDTAARVRTAITAAYGAAVGARDEVRSAAVGAGTAPPKPVAPRPPARKRDARETKVPVAELVQGDLVERILRTHDLSKSAIQRFRKVKQLMTYGHVRIEPNSRDFEHWIALERESMQLLKSFMSNTCKILGSRDVSLRLRSLLVRLVESFGGDEYLGSESVSDFLTRQLFLPKENYSSVLNKTIDDLVAWWRKHASKEKGRQFRRTICRSAYLFNNVDSDVRIDPDKIEAEDPAGFSWRPKPQAQVRSYKWGYKLVNELNYYFVPVSYFPADPKQ